MKRRWIVLAAVLWLGTVADAAAQEVNSWHRIGAPVGTVARGWLDWSRNTVDGRACLFSGHSATMPENDVWCFDGTDWELVFPGDQSVSDSYPNGADLHAFGWDNVAKRYYVFDGKFGPQQWAFDYLTRTWSPLGEADFAGISARSRVSGAGTATSPDHNLLVIVQGAVGSGGAPSRVVRIFDLAQRTYQEITPPIPQARTAIQNQFLYIPSIRQFLLFGGRTSSTNYLNDLHLFNPVTRQWTPVQQTNPPPGTANGMMAYDPDQDIVYLTGGQGGSERVWILRIANWTWEQLPTPSGSPLVNYPPQRFWGTSTFLSSAGFCGIFGGLSGGTSGQSKQTWCFRHAVGGDTVPPAPPPSGTTQVQAPDTVDLTAYWTASPSDPADVDHYELQRSEDGGVTFGHQVNIAATGSPSYQYTYQAVKPGKVQVRAVDQAGNRSPFLIFGD